MARIAFDSTGSAPAPSPAPKPSKRALVSTSTSAAQPLKRSRVAHFDSDDEADAQAADVLDPLPQSGWGGRAEEASSGMRTGVLRKTRLKKLTIADRNRLKDEANRLEAGRALLPVSEGEQRFPSVLCASGRW